MKTAIITILINIAIIIGYLRWCFHHDHDWSGYNEREIYLFCFFCAHILWSLVLGIIAKISGYERIASVFFTSSMVAAAIGGFILYGSSSNI